MNHADCAPTDPSLLFAPAVARNGEPILQVLKECLPRTGTILEVASGSGEHAVWFAPHFPDLAWQPSDPDPRSRASVAAHRVAASVTTIQDPLDLDASAEQWPIDEAQAVLCINMIHISPWEAAEGLLRGAGRLLPTGGPLIIYGPFARFGRHTAPSNACFDADLRRRNPAWGIRALEDISSTAAALDLHLERIVDMPANNLTLVFRKQ